MTIRGVSWLGVLLMILVAACSGETATSTTEAPIASPLSDVAEEDLASIDTHFAPIDAEMDAAEDLLVEGASQEAVEAHIATYYSPAVVFEDVSFGDRTEGREDLVGPWFDFISAFGGASIDSELQVGDPTALHFVSYWGVDIGGLEFTETSPFLEVSLVAVEDNMIASQVLFLDLETLGRIFGEDIPAMDVTLQQDYADAWNSGDLDQIVGLYRADAVRHDGLAGVEAKGASEIEAELEQWLSQTEGASWTVGIPFAETTGSRVGAVYEVTADGCSVEIGIVFDVDDGQIAQEILHYDTDSLRTCEWVR